MFKKKNFREKIQKSKARKFWLRLCDSVGVQYYRYWFFRKKVRVECPGTCSRASFPRDAFLKNSKINQIISLFILWVEPKCGGYSSVIERWSLSQVFRHISLRFQFKGSDINKIINFHFWNKISHKDFL